MISPPSRRWRSVGVARLIALWVFVIAWLLTLYRVESLQAAIAEVQFSGYSMVTFVESVSLPNWVEMIRRIALILLAVLLVYLLGSRRIYSLPKIARVCLAVAIAWRAIFMLQSWLLAGWSANLLFDQLSVFVIACGVLMCIGARRVFWRRLLPYFSLTAIAVSILVLIAWTQWDGGNRAEGIRAFRGYSPVLMATMMFVFAARISLWPWRAGVVLLVLAAALIIAVGTDTRANYVFILLALVVYAALRWRSLRGAEKVLLVGFVAAASVGLVLFLPSISEIVEGSRLMQDTRTLQMAKFFHEIGPEELLVGNPIAGRDPRFAFDENRWGIDSGMLAVLYVGGVPLLALFFMLHVRPVLRAMRPWVGRADAAVIATSVAYLTQMISSEMPAISEEYVLLLILLGRCFAIRRRVPMVSA